MSKEIMRQALDAIAALREAITQPVQPAEQQSQPTNIAPCEVLRNHGKCWRNACVVAGACTAHLKCEVLRNHGKCWRNACVVAGACTAQLVQPAKQQSQDALDAARSAEQGDIKDAQRLDYCYQQAMGAFINAPITKQQWLNGLDAAIAARGAT